MVEKMEISEFENTVMIIVSESIDEVVQYIEALYLKDLDHIGYLKQSKMFEDIVKDWCER